MSQSGLVFRHLSGGKCRNTRPDPLGNWCTNSRFPDGSSSATRPDSRGFLAVWRWHLACHPGGHKRLHQGITHETHLFSETPHPFWLARGAGDGGGRGAGLAYGRADRATASRYAVECRSGEGAPDRRAQRVERRHAAASRRAADRRNAHPRSAADPSFNDDDWQDDRRGPYAKVEASLSTLLGSEPPAPATATPSAVGTSGAASDLDPMIRAKLVEFPRVPGHVQDRGEHGRASNGCATCKAAAAPPPQPRHHQRRHQRRNLRRCRPRLQRPQQHPRRHRRQHLRPRQTRDRTRRHRQTPASVMVGTFPVWRAICFFTWRPWR